MAETLKEYFNHLSHQLDPAKVAGMKATYQFVATGARGGHWFVKIANGGATVAEGSDPSPSITLTAAAEDWLDIINGNMNGQTAFLTGKMKIQGDVTLAMKLESILNL